MPTITLLDTLLGVFEKLSLAFIKNDAEQMKRYQIGLNAIMEQYGDMTDITPLFLANDLVKASVGDLKEITDIPVFEMFSNKTVNKEKNSNTTKLF